MEKETIVEATGVKKKYEVGTQTIDALRGTTLVINRGDFITIQGPSGCGKTTLLNLIGVMDVPTSGIVMISGKNTLKMTSNEISARRNRTGFVFQSYNLLEDLTALENVTLPLIARGVKESERVEKARVMLERVGLSKRMNNMPSELSGGEQQRVAIARAMVAEPELIIADEPTGDLDTKTGKEIIDLIVEVNEKYGHTVIIVTHNPGIGAMGKRRVFMEDGMIIKEE